MKNNQAEPNATDAEDATGAPRRRLLKAAVAGLLAGVSAPLLSGTAFTQTADKRAGRVLIAFYSRTGTTRELANQIQQRIGGDLIVIGKINSDVGVFKSLDDQLDMQIELAR